jgi:ribosome-associated protein
MMTTKQISKLVIETLDNNKALQITEIDVTSLTDVTDRMIICSATSKRHATGLADHVITQAKSHGQQPLGIEGEKEAEWILIDLNNVVVNIMLPEVREFYSLEKLWHVTEATTVNV